jgi:hypothetical protein
MSAPIRDVEPVQAVAGDTLAWTRAFSDFPASAGWGLTYAFRLQLGAGVLNVTASTVGDGFAATITAAQSALMTPGLWSWAAYVTKTTERYQVGTGTLTITPNLATIDYSTDLRSPVKRAYDNALKAWEAVTLGQTVTLNGRTYTQHNLKDLIVYVDRCKADYAAELQAAQLAATGINPRKIGVRLVRV